MKKRNHTGLSVTTSNRIFVAVVCILSIIVQIKEGYAWLLLQNLIVSVIGGIIGWILLSIFRHIEKKSNNK